MKDMIKTVLNSSIMGLVGDDRIFNLCHNLTYRGMMVRKGSVWMDNKERYSHNEEIQSKYLLIDADIMIDAQDETLTINSTPEQPIKVVGTMNTRQSTHPETISLGSNRCQQNPITPDTVTHTSTLIRRNQVTTTVTPLRYNRTAATETACP
jgi:hypothetical protein